MSGLMRHIQEKSKRDGEREKKTGDEEKETKKQEKKNKLNAVCVYVYRCNYTRTIAMPL